MIFEPACLGLPMHTSVGTNQRSDGRRRVPCGVEPNNSV
jgi:hypothetical protein